jgi:stage II sporulation protein D
MKKLLIYPLLMTVIIIVLPFIIVRGCVFEYSSNVENRIITDTGIKINVYLVDESEIREMDLEEYVAGVVTAEMPALFEPEALKAQAVAARTYAYARMTGDYAGKEDVHFGADVCTDFAHCQAWISKEDAYENWGTLSAALNWNKICKAVKETQGLIITYNNSIANPLFHSCSGGKTENSQEVWAGVEVPYLTSVASGGEEINPNFETVFDISVQEFVQTLKEQYPEIEINESEPLKDVEILEYTGGGGVGSIRLGSITISGVDMRNAFSLKSTKFEISANDSGSISITTYGSGHGVGMSQWGANYIAKSGGTYDEILKYYYTGVQITPIGEYNGQ